MKKKLSEKAAKVLVKDLDEKELANVTGGGTTPTVGGPGGCRTCGILVTTGS